MDKRGDHPVSIVLIMVSMVVVILVLLAIFFSIRNSLFMDSDDGICAAQIRTHSALAATTNDQVAPQIKCPTKIVHVETTDEREAKDAIAHEMASCWGKWGKGQINLFGRDEGIYCQVCSMVSVDGVNQVQGMPKYLDGTVYKNGETYAQYLSGVKDGEVFDEKTYPEAATVTLSTTEPVGVIFYHAKGLTGIQRLQSAILGDPMRGMLQGAAAGAAGTGAGLFGVGVVAGVISAPVVIPGVVATTIVMGGVAIGASAGLWTSVMEKPELSTMSVVVVRPLRQDQIAGLGCQYAPVAS